MRIASLRTGLVAVAVLAATVFAVGLDTKGASAQTPFVPVGPIVTTSGPVFPVNPFIPVGSVVRVGSVVPFSTGACSMAISGQTVGDITVSVPCSSGTQFITSPLFQQFITSPQFVTSPQFITSPQFLNATRVVSGAIGLPSSCLIPTTGGWLRVC